MYGLTPEERTPSAARIGAFVAPYLASRTSQGSAMPPDFRPSLKVVGRPASACTHGRHTSKIMRTQSD